MSEERNGMSRNALYNKASEDFRTLIAAWSSFAGETTKKHAAPLKPLAEEDLLRRIDDPALRALLGGIVAERNRLRGEVNLLRANANVVIDRRTLPTMRRWPYVACAWLDVLLKKPRRERRQRAPNSRATQIPPVASRSSAPRPRQ